MKITALEVDGYGVWSGLKLDDISEGLNVFFGPNEAGKTTLMQFVRSVLYGFTSQRGRYLPPLRGGRSGGSVHVVGPNGCFQVSRYRDQEDPHAPDQVALSATDGTRQGAHLLKVLLCNIDEAIFNNVFAVGLEELQELGTLDNTEAASLLYALSAGLDRVALVDVVRELEGSRNRLLSADGGPCQVSQLLAEREKLRSQVEELDELSHRYFRLAVERDQLQRETTRLEEEANQLQHQARVIEIAAAVDVRWQRRRELDGQLLALGPMETMPEGTLERLDAAEARLEKYGRLMSQFKHEWEELRAKAADLKVNEALWRLAPRIEALAEQEPWIGTLGSRSAELETEITDLEAQLSAEQERFGLSKQAADEALPSVSARSLRTLRQPARELRRCRQRLEEVEQEIAVARETAQSLAAQIDAALSAGGERSLAEAMGRTGSQVSQLRRRVQIDERLDQMDGYQVQLEQRSRDLIQRQVLPVGVLMGLGGVFIVSVLLMMAGLFMPESITGSLGWLLALFGLAGLGAAVATKFILERSNARRLEGCQKQIGMLRLQISEARQERDTLGRQLSVEEASVAGRLETAEEELAQLEELVPLDARRKAAEQEAEAAAGRARQAQGELDSARRRWQEALHALGLPTRLSPKQVRDLATRCDYVRELHRRLESRYEEYEGRRRELEALTGRIAQLASDANLAVQSDDPIQQVRALAAELSEQEARLKSREVLRTHARQLKRKRAKCQAAIRRLKRRRRDILLQVGAEDEHEFRRRAAEIARAEVLRRERDSLGREIEAAIAGHCPEESIREQLEDDRSDGLEQRYEQLEKRREATEAKLRERFEKRGRLNEQLKALADDNRPAAIRLELAIVEKRLEDAIHRWQVLAVASRILKAIRTTYEQDRQPETLQDASGYLKRLTQGRYVRVWTPLDEDVLLVDDAEGKSLPVEVLSRGVREQLFLCLRLALSSSFARRGAHLPLVLDDVLVNFDAERAKAAVAVLRDFAAAGHQLLVFTCHEHILKLFKSLRVQVRQLPGRGRLDVAATPARKPANKRRKRRSQPEQSPHELVAEWEGREGQGDVAEPLDENEGQKTPNERIAEEQIEPVDGFDPWDETASDGPAQPVAREDEEEDSEHGDYYDDQGSYDDHGVEIGDQAEVDEEDDGEEDDAEEDEEDAEYDDEQYEEDDYEDDYEDDFGEAEAA